MYVDYEEHWHYSFHSYYIISCMNQGWRSDSRSQFNLINHKYPSIGHFFEKSYWRNVHLFIQYIHYCGTKTFLYSSISFYMSSTFRERLQLRWTWNVCLCKQLDQFGTCVLEHPAKIEQTKSIWHINLSGGVLNIRTTTFRTCTGKGHKFGVVPKFSK